MHCSVMGREALHAAIANYRGEEWQDDHEEGALVCKCFAVDSALIEETVRANGLSTVEQVTNYTKAGGSCATCHEAIEEILGRVAAERCTAPMVEPKPVAPHPAAAVKPKLTNFQRMRKIEEVVESIRPMLQRDHGDIEIVEVDGRNIYVKLQGACHGCMMEHATLSGIQSQLAEALGEMVRVLPVAAMGH
jgi:NifU-like protein